MSNLRLLLTFLVSLPIFANEKVTRFSYNEEVAAFWRAKIKDLPTYRYPYDQLAKRLKKKKAKPPLPFLAMEVLSTMIQLVRQRAIKV